MGPRSITRDDFDKSYTGVAMEAHPGPDFERTGQQRGILVSLGSRMQGLGGGFGMLLGVSLLLVLPTVVVPALLQIFINRVMIQELQPQRLLSQLVLGLILALIVAAGLTWLQQTLLLRVELRFALGQSATFLWHVLRLPLSFFDQRYRGDISRRIDANDRIALLIGGGFGAVLLNSLMSVFIVLVMLTYSPALTAIALVTPIAAIVMLRFIERRRTDLALRLQVEMAKLGSTSVVGLQTIETLKALGGERDFFAKWTGYHARTIDTEQELDRYDVWTNAFSPLFQGLTTAAVLGVGSLIIIQGGLTLGALIAFQTLTVTFQNQFRRLIQVASQAQKSVGDLARLDDALRYQLDWRFADGENESTTNDIKVSGQLTLEGVGFRFSPLDPEFIQDLDLEVAPGAWVALVGRSGSGKSTLGRLITGLYTPSSGEILLDGRSLQSWGRLRLAQSVATVDQEIAIFEGTLKDNVTLWDDTIPYSDLVDAVHDAYLTEVVEALPDNYDGWLEEDGRNLSGGQRQRVEIARALARNPSLLLLDEATSALDPITELRIANAVRRRGCTCIIVAHRLSTIRDADEIIVLHNGKIVERGVHAELLAAGGEYAQLIADE
jgi:NHLM bacteriocin system ABC transporter peptidase/ATP-binding protein